METVEDLCDHIALINKSKKILEGSKKQVKDQFRTNTFSIEHKGRFLLSTNQYELLNQVEGEEDHFNSIIKMKTNGSPNELLRDLIQLTEVTGFKEKIPAMSEIFITLVKGESHE